MRSSFPARRLVPVAAAAFSLFTLAPGLASAHEPETPAVEAPAPEANVVPIVGGFSISTRDSDDHSVADGCVTPGTHRLLCFDFWTNNIGRGDFVIGSPEERPDLFVASESHGHYHLKDFNEFALFDLAGNPVITGAKQAFCLMDTEKMSDWGAEEGTFSDCNENQGISAGWADLYSSDLPCQFVVIDGLADGTYVLRSTTNAQQVVPESSFADNTIYTYLQISGPHVTQLEGPPPWADHPVNWDV
ncbi:MAG: lysyl oxidase family protein [Acidimicrobiia bacterium]